MVEESTTPDLVELVRRITKAASARDLDTVLSFYAPDAVWDMRPTGLGTYEGAAAIRGFFEDWNGAYEEFAMEAEEILDLGNGVAFAVFIQRGRPTGSKGHVQVRHAAVAVWVDGVIERNTNYADLDEAHAAAERLAASRVPLVLPALSRDPQLPEVDKY